MKITPAVVRVHLKKVLSSESFREAGRLKQLLQYIVVETLSGRAGCLKEFQLAVDVFDKPVSFDPRLDPIVRVQAGRLRARLSEYYNAEGTDDVVQIHVPKGTYVPFFTTVQHDETTPRSFDASHILFYVGFCAGLASALAVNESTDAGFDKMALKISKYESETLATS